jgi:hypothetical protein
LLAGDVISSIDGKRGPLLLNEVNSFLKLKKKMDNYGVTRKECPEIQV